MKQLTLLTRTGCHLCADAQVIVQAVAVRAGARLTEVDVDGDSELRAEYGDMVPVLLIDGVQHGYFHIDPDRLEQALLA